MNYKHFFFSVFFAFLATLSFGQIEKTFHQTFETKDVQNIQLEMFGEYELVPWAGSNVLVETSIQLYNSNESILKHFIEKENRYVVDADTTVAGTLKLYSHDMKRMALRSKGGVASTEYVVTRIFIPEIYTVVDKKTLVLTATEKN